MNSTTNALNWFEIPVTDMARAKHFYQVAFSIHLEDADMQGIQMAMFPYDMASDKVGGALVKSDYQKPSPDGVTVYLNANPDMTDVLQRIQSEGGHIIMDKTQITPEIGYMAFFIDSEGNKLGLHSQE